MKTATVNGEYLEYSKMSVLKKLIKKHGGKVGNNFKAGDGFKAGYGFKAGNNFTAGYDFTAGRDFTAGDNFTAGRNFTAGDNFKAGDGFNILFFARFDNLYKYRIILCILNNGDRWVAMGCHNRKLEDWESDFWNNPSEFPENSEQGQQRLKAFNFAKIWFNFQ